MRRLVATREPVGQVAEVRVPEAIVILEAVAEETVPTHVAQPDDADRIREIVVVSPTLDEHQSRQEVAVARDAAERADMGAAQVAQREDVGHEEHEWIEPPVLMSEVEGSDQCGRDDRGE